MLGLKLPTDPRWVDLAEKDIEEILVDHAYCEQKAATSCISLIIQFPEFQEMVDTLMPVVHEEWTHFEMVVAELKKRGFSLGRQRSDEYVNQLLKHEKKGGSRAQQLTEKLLINALIEARSCERFRLLSLNIADPHLKIFYHELMVSEAGHYRNFIQLARKYFPEKKVELRWQEFLAIEAGIMKNLQLRGDRMH
jgi:tRNA-(ms[2]io[6]A)-hydroxylase